MTRRKAAAFAAMVLGAGLAGCGGDGGTGNSISNFATGPVPSVGSVGAVAQRTLLPATADTHEVETDGNWIVWKARQINLGYFNGSAYSNLNLGLGGAVTPFAFNTCEGSPIAFDGSRMAFVADDVSDAALGALYVGSPGSTPKKIALPAAVSSRDLETFRVAVHGNTASVLDTGSNLLYVADLTDAAPALAELGFTGDVEGPPGAGLLPLSWAGALELLDLAAGTQAPLTGDADVNTFPEWVRFGSGAFTWTENGKAFLYEPGVSADSVRVAPSANAQAFAIAGPDYVVWAENGSTWSIGRDELGTGTPVELPGVTAQLTEVQAGDGFLAWLGSDGNGWAQLYVYDLATKAAAPVTADVGSGWGNSDEVFLVVDGARAYFKQEFTNLHSPGRVLKLYDHAAGTVRVLVDGRRFQQIPMMVAAGGKALVLTRDHSFRLLARKAGASGAPVVFTPQSFDVGTFDVAGGRVVMAALDRTLYLDNPYLADELSNAEFLREIYALDLDAGGSPRRLTYNAIEDAVPRTDGKWIVWRDANDWVFAMNGLTDELQVIGETDDEIRVAGGLAAWRDPGRYVHYFDLEAGVTERIGAGSAEFCPDVAGRVIAWTTSDRTAHYYDLAAPAPADAPVAGSRPTFVNWGSEYAAPVSTDGRFLTWVEHRVGWDHDGDLGAVTAPIEANVVVVHDLTTDASLDLPAADFTQTGVGLNSSDDGNEGPVCHPKVTRGVVVFGAIEYGVDNPDGDKEVFMSDVTAAVPAVTRITTDPEDDGRWDSRIRVGGNLAVWRSGGASRWDWRGKVPAAAKLK